MAMRLARLAIPTARMPRGEPKLWLEADETESRLAGLTLTRIASQVQAAYEGSVAGELLEDIEGLPVRGNPEMNTGFSIGCSRRSGCSLM